MKRGKRYKKSAELFKKKQAYTIDEALEILKKIPKAKFDETVEVHIKTSINAKKNDEQVRGTVILPNGTGKEVKIIAFTEKQEVEAKKAGAEKVGGMNLIEEIQNGGVINFDVAVATPEMMPKLAKIAKIIGPKGLMPNTKTQTVGPKIGEIIEALKKGKVSFKNDDSGNFHQAIGKISFAVEKLKENYETFLMELNKSKPSAVKGKFIETISISSTMSPSVRIKK